MIKFQELGISQPILNALREMGFETPTEVQSKAIPHILNKEDMIVMSKTGSGKTAVFGIPLLQLTDAEAEGPQCLILTPTRELAVQIDNDIKKMAKNLAHKITAVYGKHSMNTELEAFKKGVTIVAGTPGRVFDHINQKNLKINNIHYLVLDEADRMLDMGFIDQVRKIVKLLPNDKVTLLFSATIPTEIRRICSSQMKNPITIEIESPTMTVDTIKQCYYRVERNEKRTQLNRLLLNYTPESCLIFCNTRIAVDQVQSFLEQKGYASQPLHGEIPQGKRLQTIQQFKLGKFPILVATDVAARGLDIKDLSMVINYDVPDDKDNYVHRIGRTGRAGKDGAAVSLVTSNEIMGIYEIEEHIGVIIEEAELPSDAALAANNEASFKWKQSQVGLVKPSLPSREQNGRTTQGRSNEKPPYNRNAPRSTERHKDYPERRSDANEIHSTERPKTIRPYDNSQSRPLRTPRPYNKPTVTENKTTVVTSTPIPVQTPTPVKSEKSFLQRLFNKFMKK